LPDEDDDVIAEAERVKSGGAANDLITLDGLRKVYPGGKVAVHELSYGIPAGECFGFLGINGAGKTSTMKMLTGDILPTEGNAALAGMDILTEQLKVRALIGYCPQFDALLELLTVREHLDLFSRIKGVPSKIRPALVQKMIQDMDLTAFENKLAGRLSGGNKRKLSVAIAMIGNPPIVFLDEPSTGMDPVARRFMWTKIAQISTRSKSCAVVLTTHSMEECEALCSRVGIMVGGRLRCLGAVQHLKSKFGSGLMMEIKLQPVTSQQVNTFLTTHPLAAQVQAITKEGIQQACEAFGDMSRAQQIGPDNDASWPVWSVMERQGSVQNKVFAEWWMGEDRVAALAGFMQHHFPRSMLVERHEGLLRYRIPATNLALASVFELIEGQKAALSILEYSVSQTTLEQIFNQFASQQEEEQGGARGINAAATAIPVAAETTSNPASGIDLNSKHKL